MSVAHILTISVAHFFYHGNMICLFPILFPIFFHDVLQKVSPLHDRDDRLWLMRILFLQNGTARASTGSCIYWFLFILYVKYIARKACCIVVRREVLVQINLKTSFERVLVPHSPWQLFRRSLPRWKSTRIKLPTSTLGVRERACHCFGLWEFYRNLRSFCCQQRCRFPQDFLLHPSSIDMICSQDSL